MKRGRTAKGSEEVLMCLKLSHVSIQLVHGHAVHSGLLIKNVYIRMLSFNIFISIITSNIFFFRQEKDEAADEKKEDEKKEDEKKEDEKKEEETGPSPSKKPRPAAASSSDVKEIVFSFDTTGSMYPCLTQVIISCMC